MPNQVVPFGSNTPLPYTGGGAPGAPSRSGLPQEEQFGLGQFDRLNQFLSGQGGTAAQAGSIFGDTTGMYSDPVLQNLQYLNMLRGGLATEGFRLRDENDRRFSEAQGRYSGAVDRITGQETFSDEDLDRMQRDLYAMGADEAAQRLAGDLGTIQSALGAAGITGGGIAADLATKAEVERFRATMDSGRRSMVALREAKIQSDANDALRNLQAELSLAQFSNQGVDTSGYETLVGLMEPTSNLLSLFMQNAQADKNRAAGEDAGWMGLAGNVVGGALSLLG